MQTTDHNQQQQHAPGALSQPAVGPEKLPGIRHIIAVGSGKGDPQSLVTQGHSAPKRTKCTESTTTPRGLIRPAVRRTAIFFAAPSL